jgi:hypothetical protein
LPYLALPLAVAEENVGDLVVLVGALEELAVEVSGLSFRDVDLLAAEIVGSDDELEESVLVILEQPLPALHHRRSNLRSLEVG